MEEYKKAANSGFSGYGWTEYCAYNNRKRREEQLEIPNMIHYCWFGGSVKNEETRNYIDGWKRILKGYEFREWNEFNFPIEEFAYARTAYEKGEYTCVNEVARVYALNRYGGVYLNTDMEVVRDFSVCLRNKSMVLGFENGGENLTTAFVASVQGHEVIKEMLDYYREYEFVPKSRECREETDVLLLTNLMRERGVVLNNWYQQTDSRISVFPQEYFGMDGAGSENRLQTENTYIVHHSGDAGVSLSEKIRSGCRKIFDVIFGDKTSRKIQMER